MFILYSSGQRCVVLLVVVYHKHLQKECQKRLFLCIIGYVGGIMDTQLSNANLPKVFEVTRILTFFKVRLQKEYLYPSGMYRQWMLFFVESGTCSLRIWMRNINWKQAAFFS